MSWEAQAWVWSLDLRANHKWVLMGIANYVDQESKCWPSLDTLSKRLGMSKQSVIANLNILIDKGMVIKSRKDHYGGNVYQLNWILEKDKKTVKESLTDLQKTSQETLTDIPDQLKNLELISPDQLKNLDPILIKNQPIKELTNKKTFDLPDWLPKDLWADFKETRKKLRRPMTLKAEELIVRKLDKLRAMGHDPGAVLEQSIERSWQGVFPVRADYQWSGETGLTDGERLTARLAQTARRGL